MTTSPFLKKFFFALSVVFIISCDNDFNELGADIIDDDIHHDMIRYEAGVVAYDKGTGSVQANNLPVNYLGVYNNPVFGNTVASFVTQLELATVNPRLIDPIIDTVYLYVPYYSTLEDTNSETGDSTYELDSVYGDVATSFNLRIHRNGYYLRSSDPGTSLTEAQKYYSDEKPMVDAVKGQQVNLNENVAFTFSKDEVKRMVNDKVDERFAPGIFMYLDKEFFQAQILDAPEGKLTNNNVFKDYFRGLYFDVQQTGGSGAMAVTRFNEGYIKIIYNDYKIDLETDEPTEERETKAMTINLAGNTVNFFENTYTTPFADAIASSDEIAGDERLYVKGGAGSVAYIDINQADIDALKEENIGQRVLINEANLVFYVDKAAMANAKEPLRLFLYDADNKRPLIDYYTDVSSTTVDPKYNKIVHDGLIRYDTDERGLLYKIRITDHISNLVNKDSTNVRLGLSITESINLIGNAALKTPFTVGGDEIETLPVPSVISPLGTVLYGSAQGENVPENRRLKLEIFYTKPN